MSDNIKVVVKVRPLISRELEDKLPHQWRVHNNTLHQVDHNGRDFGQAFTFDKVYCENTKTSDVYNDVAKPIVEAATAGFNGTIFAYGQTSSGKTYTMTGTEKSPGIIPLSVINLFEIIKGVPDRDFLVRVSYIEIYNETLKDLLDVKKENIKIHENYDGCIKVDATEKVTSSPEEVLEAMKEGEANRQTGATNMNEKSSRSHSIFQITIESREHIEGNEEAGCVNVSQLNLVDLAGSERAGQTGATGLRFKEGTHINKSLSALALVIKQLSEGPNKYANYRDSKLTRILQNSLGGNAKTSIICAITPAALEETISTLQFATRAKKIKNKPEVNAVATDATMIQDLTKQLAKLQTQLETKKNLEVILENKKTVEQDLQKQIANLQKLILNGFGQGSNIEQRGGARRKQPLRRITISTLHSIDTDQDPVPTVPRFCTPSLKYNPLTVQKPSDFMPIQTTNRLPSLPEEPPRLVTPTPTDKKVNFGDIIEIDSDDDNNSTNSTLPTCSPYHNCYSTSKTPPCVLRKNYHQAEKDYKEILEFTEREKIFKPDVVELMEKLELSNNMTANLRDEIEAIKKNSKEKDLETEHLMFKIKNYEEDIKNAQMELEKRNTKITDLEVSYEILEKKARLREEELISLIKDQKQKKCEDIGKLPPKPFERDQISFMDMSKDISLVNSDNENSVIASNEEEVEQFKVLVSNLQDQLIAKCQTIVQLEANIESQKKSIEFLENSSHDLEKLVETYKEKTAILESENNLYKSNFDALNETIKTQKHNLEIAQKDIESYTSTIQELQVTLTKKEHLLNINIGEPLLENMIANEQKVIANNENIKNIIYSFKITLDKRNKEIENLKSLRDVNVNETQINSSTNKIKENEKQIDILNEEISVLNEKAKSNITTINSLMREKSNFAGVEEELIKKLAVLENEKMDLHKLSEEHELKINNLNESNQNLLQSVSDNTAKEQEHLQLIDNLKIKLGEMTQKINQTEDEINAKNDMISSLTKLNTDKQECEDHAKSALSKLKCVMSILRGDMQEIPDFIENCVALLSAISSGLCLLENVATDTISEKDCMIKENSQLKQQILDFHNQFDVEKTKLQNRIDELLQVVEKNLLKFEQLKETNLKLREELNSEYEEKLSTKNIEYQILLEECNSFKAAAAKLSEELLLKQETISSLNEKEAEFDGRIKDLEKRLQNSDAILKTEQEQLKMKEEIITKILSTIEDLKSELRNKHEELNSLLEKSTQVKDQQMEVIFNRLGLVVKNFNIENNVSNEDVDDGDYYDLVLLLLDKITKESLANYDSIKHELYNAKIYVETLLDDNRELKETLADLENDNKLLTTELEKNNSDKQSLCEHLTENNSVLEQLKEDLEYKARLVKVMETKAQQYKQQLDDQQMAMNKKMEEILSENETSVQKVLTNENQIHTDSFPNQTPAPRSEKHSKSLLEYSNMQAHIKAITPPSLLTICCNKIVDAMEPKQNESNLATPDSSITNIQNSTKSQNCPGCESISLELRNLQQEKYSLMSIVEETERANKELILEQENIRQEVRLLLEPAQDLQKKISSHKTNLSILTATTYAENRSLKSQVLALKHHHNKLLNVCQGDIPEFRKQLRELFVMLNSDYNYECQNINTKRYSLPDVLDNNTTVNFKNESTLDGDLLMLDTNVTLTTTGDNTLVGCDQTCLDMTQTLFNEASYQTNDLNKTDSNITRVLERDSQSSLTSLEMLKEENCKLKALVNTLSGVKVDSQTSPFKPTMTYEPLCTKCQNINQNNTPAQTISEDEVKYLTRKLEDIEIEKQSFEEKYKSLVLEIPNTDALVIKLKHLENELSLKCDEVIKLANTLNIKNKEMKRLLDENDTLSNQVMDSISEVDNLNEELKRIKNINHELAQNVRSLETKQVNTLKCPKCQSSEIEATRSVQNADSPHAKLSRSLSDSETSSRYNKICTLQSELCAGREDCKVLTEHVETIKQHLNCSNMDLDESMGDANVSLSKNATPNSQQIVCNMPDIQEEQSLDVYSVDRIDCYNYYLEITGEEREDVSNDVKIIDILKMFYNNLLEKHGSEIENLVNQLKNYEESSSAFAETLAEKKKSLTSVTKFMSQVQCSIKRINNKINSHQNGEDLKKIIDFFQQNFLELIDYEFGTSSTSVFEVIIDMINKSHHDLNQTKVENDKLNIEEELTIANNNLQKLKKKLADKETEYDLLKSQKKKMLEISSAVTLDVVKKEQEFQKSLMEACQKLFQHKLITSDLSLTESAVNNVNIIFDNIINAHYQLLRTENEKLSSDIEKSKNVIVDKEKELVELKEQIHSLKVINDNVSEDLAEKERKIQELKSAHEVLSKAYDSKIQENIKKVNEIDQLSEEISNLIEVLNEKESVACLVAEKDSKITELFNSLEELKQQNEKLNVVITHQEKTINKKEALITSMSEKEAEITKAIDSIKELQKLNGELTEEISNLKESINKKESLISSLSEKNAKTTELLQSITDLQTQKEKLLSINQILSNEREMYSSGLQKSSETIQQNNAEIEKMTADILILRESVKDATSIIESLKQDVQKLTVVNAELKLSLEEKKRECLRLNMNIKTHDKTAELQSKIIMRLNKQKEEDDKVINEKQTAINEASEKYNILKNECEKLKNAKESLEARVNELQELADKPRMSLDADSRRRRQSIHDSKRILTDLEEQCNAEAVFGSRSKPDDLFADDNSSGRSTPFGLGKGRDSLLSRTDQSDKDEEHSSRPSSVQAARRRRQSIHDMHRGVARQTPSPHDLSSRINDDHSLKDSSANKSISGEVNILRAQLTACQQELEELKESYRELDEECETCAEYLRERDEQCGRLKEERDALKKQISDLKTCTPTSEKKQSVAHVAVNTDEDWANLHAVVVDRMSYDAEVEKTKKLTKTNEELRFQKQDLKNTIAKMQKALEKQHSSRDTRELEATKKELDSVKEELEELKMKFKELDEECETCAEYLKEREEQCMRLKEAKLALETRLQQLQEDSHAMVHYSVRKKRQTVHDLNRNSVLDQTDVSTETNEDSLSNQAEREDSSQKGPDDKLSEIKRLKMIVEKLSHQKAAMEQQLKTAAASPAQAMYVATGSAIVQSQQLTDVMKENQRLKKINAKLVNICKKRGKSENRENEDPCEQA